MRTIFIGLLMFLINSIWVSSQIVDYVIFESNEGTSKVAFCQENCKLCIANDFKKDYLVLEQIRTKETKDYFNSRLYIFVGFYYMELVLDKKECVKEEDSIKCTNYFLLTNKILKFVTENHFPNPIVRNMYLIRDDKIEIFRPNTEEGIIFYNLIKEYYMYNYD